MDKEHLPQIRKVFNKSGSMLYVSAVLKSGGRGGQMHVELLAPIWRSEWMLHSIGDKNSESDGSRAELHDPRLLNVCLPFPEGRLGGLKQKIKYNNFYFF